MGCGASSCDVRPSRDDWSEANSGNVNSVSYAVNDSTDRQQRSSRNFSGGNQDDLAELVAVADDEVAAFRFIGSSASSTNDNEETAKCLTACEVNTHSNILNIETPGEGSTSWSSALIRQECAMCLEEFEVGDKLRVLHCSHTFHMNCIDAWFSRARTCPFCLQDITKLPQPVSPYNIKCLTSPVAKPVAPNKFVHENSVLLIG